MVTYAAPRTNADGDQLCTVAARCNGLAVAQGAYSCGDCDDVADAHRDQLDKLTVERDQHDRALDLVREEMRTRADAGDDARLSTAEAFAVRLGMDQVKQLGADIARLTAAHQAVLEEHTHPVFACKKHVDQLPEWPRVAGADDDHLHR